MAKQRRYRRYTPGPDPLAPPPDLTKAVRAIADDVMYGYSTEQAMREYLRREGYDDFLRQIAERRQELLHKTNLGGTLREAKKLLDEAVLAERGQLARDVDMDDLDRTMREMTLDNLPVSPAAAVTELNGYDWASSEAREKYQQIKDLIGRELLDQRFAGMKEALEGATDEDRASVAEMLRDLNVLLGKHRAGMATEQDFQDFMAKHGDQFPENPRNIEELVELLAQRSAAAQRLLNSMTPEQRAELMQLAAEAFGSEELMNLVGELDANLRGIRPDLDWTGSESFDGDEASGGMGLGEATRAMRDLGRLDELAATLGGERPGDIDLDDVADLLGADAATSAKHLRDLEKALHDSGLLNKGESGSLQLSPKALRMLGKELLKGATSQLSRGQRDSRLAGQQGEPTGGTRPWEFGDTQAWDTTRTITNALQRSAASGEPFAITVNDIEVVETEVRTKNAVALLVDTSFSMAMEGRWTPMKQTALALNHLITTQFRSDELALIGFGLYAQTLTIEELTALPPMQEKGTNLQHALLLANEFFTRHADYDPTLLIVTDGEPTSILTEWGQAYFNWPTDRITLARTVDALDSVTKRGTKITFFRLGDDPGLVSLIDALANRSGANVVAPDLNELGGAVVGEYLHW
ncbi:MULTISPECIES: VWA domain-containing protein [unclassified Corynebacterium]|uniref:vWA domain-containing protein n=1 Tax=unclassified Corynebacterium TaxID=2624378 RepID=UPI00264BAE56|nr:MULTISPECIES: VWA domain-containing protein [unclassified Corynebacterium]MDN8594767.1 VWA domain-containing protein [Corynebacterium sp. P4_F2]WKK56383.1 VWA domain-containing protein [Corynebacterium sp. P4-C1]WKK63815.1 VWA domain-containing protein [Corynebacterium sp. P8-C1]